jgi:tRNA(Ile)-lysidine synthase
LARSALYAEFLRAVSEWGIVAPGEGVVVAVSGGVDSMSLLDLAVRASRSRGFCVSAAHVNYRLRGADSDADEALVRDAAARLGIPFDVRRVRPPAGENTQDAARCIRQRFLRSVAKRRKARAVLLGHNRGDQAETILMHMLRGAGLAGLCGMRPCSEGGGVCFARPLLTASRAEIERYAGERGIAFREDRTNATTRYRRNDFRHRLMPLLREFNPRAEEALASLAARLAADDDALNAIAVSALETLKSGKEMRSGAIARDGYAGLPAALRRRVLRLAYALAAGTTADLNSDQLRRMDEIAMSSRARGEYRLKAPWSFKCDRDQLTIAQNRGSKLKAQR